MISEPCAKSLYLLRTPVTERKLRTSHGALRALGGFGPFLSAQEENAFWWEAWLRNTNLNGPGQKRAGVRRKSTNGDIAGGVIAKDEVAIPQNRSFDG